MRPVFSLLMMVCVLASIETQVLGQDFDFSFPCGTSPELDDMLKREADEFMKNRRGPVALCGDVKEEEEPPVIAREIDGILVVEADTRFVSTTKAFDLDKQQFHFTRNVPDTPGEPFTFDIVHEQVTPAEGDEPYGPLVRTFDDTLEAEHYVLPFAFPFGDQVYTEVNLAPYVGVEFGEADFDGYYPMTTFAPVVFQHTMTSLLFEDGSSFNVDNRPRILPLMVTNRWDTATRKMILHIKESPDAVTFTWVSQYFDFAVQVTLHSDGSFELSYPVAPSGRGLGNIYVSTGDTSWYPGLVPLASGAESVPGITGDVPDAPDYWDITSFTVEQREGLNRFEFVFHVGSVIPEPADLQGGPQFRYVIEGRTEGSEDPLFSAQIFLGGNFVVAVDGGTLDGRAIAFDGDTVRARFFVPEAADNVTLSAQVVIGSESDETLQVVDEVTAAPVDLSFVTMESVYHPDLSELTVRENHHGPICETFRLGRLNVNILYNLLKEQYGLNDETLDGMMMYQNFLTQIVFFAGAYHTAGSDGSTGTGGPEIPVHPSLTHMNALNYGWNATDPLRISVLNHEFGHRWLYYSPFGMASGPHPKKGAHLPAAFALDEPGSPAQSIFEDLKIGHYSSAMGGSYWTNLGDGTFLSPMQQPYYGYSWSELYAMGLACAAEMVGQECFTTVNCATADTGGYYINNTELNAAYFPDLDTIYPGLAIDIPEQITACSDPRQPSYDPTAPPKEFEVIMVLIVREGTPLTVEDLNNIRHTADIWKLGFETAVGGRATLDVDADLDTFADYDHDGDVDLLDFGTFQISYSGPVGSPNYVRPPTAALLAFDEDLDGDIDIVDFGKFQVAFTGG